MIGFNPSLKAGVNDIITVFGFSPEWSVTFFKFKFFLHCRSLQAVD